MRSNLLFAFNMGLVTLGVAASVSLIATLVGWSVWLVIKLMITWGL